MFKLKNIHSFHAQLAKRFTIEYCKNNNILKLFNDNIEHKFYYDINTAFSWYGSKQGRRFWLKHFLDSVIEINKRATQYKKYGLTDFYCDEQYDDDGNQFYVPLLEYMESEIEDIFPEIHSVKE